MRVFLWSAVVLAIVTPGVATTAPPEIRSIVPPGLQRGVETQLTFYGPGFGAGMELVLPFPAEIKLNSASRTCAPGNLRSQLNSATLDEMASWEM